MKGSLGDKLYHEWRRMPAMDISGVMYNAFHLNRTAFKNYSDCKVAED